jgi:hypothetical protein
MSWVNDLASVAGIPGGAAVVAGAMYGACAAAEKAARPESPSEDFIKDYRVFSA